MPLSRLYDKYEAYCPFNAGQEFHCLFLTLYVNFTFLLKKKKLNLAKVLTTESAFQNTENETRKMNKKCQIISQIRTLQVFSPTLLTFKSWRKPFTVPVLVT